ncbi:MAG: PKD domain-containing protein [Bacteroidota bacterium]
MKQSHLVATLSISIFLLSSQSSMASHYMGMELSYEHVDSCVYKVYQSAYYYCGNAFMSFGGYVPINYSTPNPPPAPALTIGNFEIEGIPTFPGQLCTDPVTVGNWVLESYTEVTQLCPSMSSKCDDLQAFISGVAAAKWSRVYDFCASTCDDYQLEWSDCCRNNAVTSGAANDGTFLDNVVIHLNDSSFNTAPVFIPDPITYIFLGNTTSAPYGAVDPDGDSLVFSLTDCYQNASMPVGYNTGYSTQAPFGPHWSVSIDSHTGWISFDPGPLAQNELAPICVLVEEYRDGVLIGTYVRDLEVSVVSFSLGSSQVPTIGGIQALSGGQSFSSDTIKVCPGVPTTMSITATDADAQDILTLSSSVEQVLQGAQITVSGTNPASMQIDWTPDSSAAGQEYFFVMSAYDETCPFVMYASKHFYVQVEGGCLQAITQPTVCNDSTGSIDLTISGLIAPLSFLWNTGDTTENLHQLGQGTYWVDVTDSTGLNTLTDTFVINSDNLILSATKTSPDCDGIGGQIDVQVSGGTPPLSYLWSNGDQTSTASGLSPGGYSVTVIDSNSCSVHEVFILDPPDSCQVSVSGTVFHDDNGNCIQDSTELGIPYMYVEINPGSATFTDANGHYTVSVDTGSYVVEALPAAGSFWGPVCPGSGQHHLSFSSYFDDTTGIDLAMEIIPVQDLTVNGGMGSAVPGTPFILYFYVYNAGNVSANADLEVELDSLMEFWSTNTSPFTYDSTSHSLLYDLGLMQPAQWVSIQIHGIIDSTAMLGTLMDLAASLTPIIGDTTPGNNVFLDTIPIVASYDPNDKQVSPTGFGEEGFIQAHEKEMLYTIRFQNTGNFPAQYVVLRDTIHHNLDLSSFQALAHSHSYTLAVEEDSILVFTFADIDLPDSTSDPAGSQGFVQFKMLHEGMLALGEEIRNSAAIYFDFNDPVITNEVVNTIYQPMALDFVLDEELCPGDSIVGMLVETGLAPFRYWWNTGVQDSNQSEIMYPTEVNNPGLYSLTVEDALGIIVTDSLFVPVQQVPIAQATMDIQGLQVEMIDASLHADSWLWDFGDGDTSTSASPSHLYSEEGEYSIRLIVNNACGADTLLLDLNLTTGLETTFAQSVEVLPNPFSRQTRIRFSNPTQERFELIILDVQGKVIRRYAAVQTDEVLVNRSNLSSGLYVFRLRNASLSYTGKLLID